MRLPLTRALPLADRTPAIIRRTRRIHLRRSQFVAAVAMSSVLAGCATGGADLLPTEVNPEDDVRAAKSARVSGIECVPGRWLIGNPSWRDLIVQQAVEEGVTVQTPTGTALIDFGADGRYSTTYTSWELWMETGDGAIVLHHNGTNEGQYSATASTIVMTESTHGSVSKGIVVTSAGSVPLPESSSQTTLMDQFSYTCEDDVLTAISPEGNIRMDRQPATGR